MRLKSEYINTLHYVKALDRNIKVEDNPFMFNFYQTIGLDFIFEKVVNDTNNKKRNK